MNTDHPQTHPRQNDEIPQIVNIVKEVFQLPDEIPQIVNIVKEVFQLPPHELYRLGRVFCQISGMETPQPEPMGEVEFIIHYIREQKRERGLSEHEITMAETLVRQGYMLWTGGHR